MALWPALEKYWEDNSVRWAGAARLLGAMDLRDPEEFSNSCAGLDSYLQACGAVANFKATEVVKPNYPWPSQATWPGALVLTMIGEKFRAFNGGHPVFSRHWYRSPMLNAQRGGAPQSDHLWACAMDFDFYNLWIPAVRARRRAQRWLLEESGIPRNVISLGVGWRMLHVGLYAPRTLALGKHRRWKYGKLPVSEMVIS